MTDIQEEEDAICIKISNNLDGISPLPTLPSTLCIFKVHNILRRVNQKAYEPDVIAIGPYHHGKENLEMMQECKLRYLHSLLQREKKCIKTFVAALKPLEPQIRGCYGGRLIQNPNELIEIMVVDGIFVIELLKKFSDTGLRQPDDLIFNMDWMLRSVQRDLLLLENQIPFFVLCNLFEFVKGENDLLHLLDWVMSFFGQILPGEVSRSWDMRNLERVYNHLLGLVHHMWVLSFPKLGLNGDLSMLEERKDWELISCATTLVESGIKFERGVGTVFDVRLVNKTLIIPPLSINDMSESVLRNLIAYEQYDQQRPHFNFVSDYVKLMDCLIDSPKDIEILCHAGIIVNWKGSNEWVSNMFNNMCESIVRPHKQSFCYAEVFNEVNMHCRKRCNSWMANLRRNYLNSPWAILKVCAGLALLVFAILQTVYTIMSFHKS